MDALQNALKDFRTNNNKLSVWSVRDDESNLERIVVALSANCDHISNFDYLLFDKQILSDLGIKSIRSIGNTPDKGANSLWHFDLIELSEQNLLELVRAIMTDQKTKIGRFLDKRIPQLVAQGVDLKQINYAKLKQGVRAKVDTFNTSFS